VTQLTIELQEPVGLRRAPSPTRTVRAKPGATLTLVPPPKSRASAPRTAVRTGTPKAQRSPKAAARPSALPRRPRQPVGKAAAKMPDPVAEPKVAKPAPAKAKSAPAKAKAKAAPAKAKAKAAPAKAKAAPAARPGRLPLTGSAPAPRPPAARPRPSSPPESARAGTKAVTKAVRLRPAGATTTTTHASNRRVGAGTRPRPAGRPDRVGSSAAKPRAAQPSCADAGPPGATGRASGKAGSSRASRAPTEAVLQSVAAEREGERWKPRPRLAWIVRSATIAVPFGMSLAAGLYVGSMLPISGGMGWRVLAWLVASIVATGVLVLIDRLFRRLVPLVVLLRLSLVFPDRAPGRVSTALRACATLRPERQLDRLGVAPDGESPAQAAQRIVTLLSALNAHDRRTRGHSERVRALVDLIAQEMGLVDADADRLRWAALLHDIGKLRTSSRILQKPSGLTRHEWELIKRHPETGASIAGALRPWLGEWWLGIGHHHERWDGGGYPAGLAGDEISLAGRIVAVADGFEVMTAPRPYRRPVGLAAAREELVRCSGQQFDPVVVRALLSVSIGRLQRVMGPLSWLGQLPVLRAVPHAQVVVATSGRQAATTLAVFSTAGVVAVGVAGPRPASTAPSHGVRPAPSEPALVRPILTHDVLVPKTGVSRRPATKLGTRTGSAGSRGGAPRKTPAQPPSARGSSSAASGSKGSPAPASTGDSPPAGRAPRGAAPVPASGAPGRAPQGAAPVPASGAPARASSTSADAPSPAPSGTSQATNRGSDADPTATDAPDSEGRSALGQVSSNAGSHDPSPPARSAPRQQDVANRR